MNMTKIIQYEAGELEEEEVVQLFQELIDSGDCWRLQGHYGRMAMMFIESGRCHQKQKQDS